MLSNLDISPHWDLFSITFYLLLAAIGAYALCRSKKKERRRKRPGRLFCANYLFWSLSWAIAAACRYVSSVTKVGGADAYAYALVFEHINSPGTYAAQRISHYGKAWEWLCRILNFICSDYHFFFFVMYLVIALAIIYFLTAFGLKNMGFAPVICAFYLYLRGFNTLRTEAAIAMLLFALVFWWKKKYAASIPFLALAAAFQTSSLLYICFIPFYIIVRKRKITVKSGLIFTVGSVAIGYVVRYLFISGTIKISYYANYAEYSVYNSFFDSYWKIVLSQLLLAAVIIILRKQIYRSRELLDKTDLARFDFIWLMCVFDLAVIPITFYIHLWRGYEFFYLARIIMWGHIITLVKKCLPSNHRLLFEFFTWIICALWLIFCVWNNWESSGLMPYVFAPLSHIY